MFGPISLFGLQLCHIMASNANKYINRVQSGCDIMQIHVERTIINNTAQIWTLASFIDFSDLVIFIAGFLQTFCI